MNSETGALRRAKLVRVAEIILGGGGLAAILVGFYCFYYYNLTGVRQFATPVGIILYEVCPAVLAILLLASLRLRPSHKIQLALLLFSTGVSIYTLELALNLVNVFATTPGFWLRAKTSGVNFDTRSRFEVIMDLRKQGIDAVPAVLPRVLLEQQPDGSQRSLISINGAEVLPLSGISNKVTVLCNETGAYTIYESDEHGFHNPKGVWDAGRVDVAALGDSFTQGACVPSDENFVALIRQRYPSTLNLGISGSGPLLMLATLHEYAAYFKPKVVLWFYCEGNDLTELNQEARAPLLMHYLTGSFQQDLFNQQVNIDNALRHYVESYIDIRLRELMEVERRESKIRWMGSLGATIKLTNLRSRLGLIYGQSSEKKKKEVQIDLLRDTLLQAKTSISAWDGRLYFVYLPSWERYGKPELANENRDSVLALVKTLGLPVIDLHSAFQAQSDPLAFFPFRKPGHYTVEGNRLVAQEVLRALALYEARTSGSSG